MVKTKGEDGWELHKTFPKASHVANKKGMVKISINGWQFRFADVHESAKIGKSDNKLCERGGNCEITVDGRRPVCKMSSEFPNVIAVSAERTTYKAHAPGGCNTCFWRHITSPRLTSSYRSRLIGLCDLIAVHFNTGYQQKPSLLLYGNAVGMQSII